MNPNALIAAGHDVRHSLSSGYQLAFLIGAGCVAAGLFLAPILLRGSKLLTEENEMSDEERHEFEAHAHAL